MTPAPAATLSLFVVNGVGVNGVCQLHSNAMSLSGSFSRGPERLASSRGQLLAMPEVLQGVYRGVCTVRRSALSVPDCSLTKFPSTS